MGNNRNKKRKNSSWRKYTGQHIGNVMKRRRAQDSNVGNDNAEKEQNMPSNTMQLPSNDRVNADEITIHELQNKEFMEIPINEIEVGLDSNSERKNYRILQKAEFLQVQHEDTEPTPNTCSDNISLEKLSPNALQINTPSDMNESDDNINRYDQYWKEYMEQKLIKFYEMFMLPELCDPRLTRNMPIRDLGECQ